METFEFTNKISSAWTDKYRPKVSADIIGNKRAIQSIIEWLKTFKKNKKAYMKEKEDKKSKNKRKPKKIKVDDISIEGEVEDEISTETNGFVLGTETYQLYNKNTPKSCMIITGNHGIGKSCSAYAILNELGYSIQVINFSKIKSAKNINEIIDKTLNSTNILNMMNGKSKEKIAIIIDELESITSSTEKLCIMTLLKNNDINWMCPIIFISNNQHNKLLSEIKKNSYEIRFYQPYPEDMNILLKRICIKEHIKLENNTVSERIIEHSQRDLRRLVFILQDLKYIYGTKQITNLMMNEYCELSKKKDTDIDLFKGGSLLMNKYTSIDECLKYYETEKVLLPLMISQNYIKYIDVMAKPTVSKFEVANKIARLMSKGDVIDNYICGEQNWDIRDIHGFITCAEPSYILHTNLKRGELTLDFPSDLNKTSIKKINKKNIINANKCLMSMNISDYIYINQIVRTLIINNKIPECIKLLNEYNIKLDNIESLLKVDKLKISKMNLTSKQKKEITTILETND